MDNGKRPTLKMANMVVVTEERRRAVASRSIAHVTSNMEHYIDFGFVRRMWVCHPY